MKFLTQHQSLACFLFAFIVWPSCQAQDSRITDSGVLIKQLAATFSSGVPVGSVQIRGSVSRFTGQSTNSGSAILIANADGSSQTTFQMTDGSRKDARSATDGGRTCQWSGPDGAIHDGYSFDCWGSQMWFLPQIALQPALLSPSLQVSMQTAPTATAAAPYSLQSYLAFPPASKDPSVAVLLQSQSTATLQVDPSTFLPSLLNYKIQADSGSATIDVEIRYRNYQSISSLMVPGRVERYLNGSLEMAITFTEITIVQ